MTTNVWPAVATGLATVVVLPGVLVGAVVLSLTSGVLAGGGCAGDGGPGGGSQQVAERTWSGEQMTNVQTITQVTWSRGLPRRAAVIAVSAAIVESDLVNVDHGDRDSLGLFQQRPSQGWGAPAELLNPATATGKFLDALVRIPDWQYLPPGVAAQRVQRSAFPQRYAPQEPPAAELVARFWTGPDEGTVSLAAVTGCVDQGGSNLALDPRQLPPNFQLPDDPQRRAAVSYALAQVGKPYLWGEKGPDAFDCSGLMQAAWAAAGVGISAGTTGQVHDGTAVASLHQVRPGDLLFIPGSLGTPANPRHVGMYAGHGVVVNAHDAQTGVITESLDSWAPEVVAIRRVGGGTPALAGSG